MAWWRSTKTLRLKGDPSLDAKIDVGLHSRELRSIALQMQAERLAEEGEFAQCAELLEKNSKDMDADALPLFEAYAAGGLLLQDKKADAEKILATARQSLGNAPKSSYEKLVDAMIGSLQGTVPVDAVMSAARENGTVTHGWFVAAVRAAQSGDRQRAAQNFERCSRTTSDLEFPYLEARAMAARMRS